MKKVWRGRIILCSLMIIDLILYWKLPIIAVLMVYQQPHLQEWMAGIVFLTVTSLAFYTLNLIAVIGLLAQKRWAFIVSYFAIIFSSLSGINYLPIYLIHHPSSLLPMIVINSTLLIYVIYLDIISRKL